MEFGIGKWDLYLPPSGHSQLVLLSFQFGLESFKDAADSKDAVADSYLCLQSEEGCPPGYWKDSNTLVRISSFLGKKRSPENEN